MGKIKHLFSESCTWITVSEFVDPKGTITKADGQSIIEIHSDHISNTSWAKMDETIRENNYRIIPQTETHYIYQSTNPELGIQRGTFDIDRNRIFSKFVIENSGLNGFEIIECEHDVCNAFGALYDNAKLLNTWKAVMKSAKTQI